MIRITNQAEAAEIYISGDIVDDSEGLWLQAWGDGDCYQWPKDIKEQLDAIDDNAPLTVYINSDGGSVPAGMAIANMIARHKGKTKCVVDGWACSIASQIFFAADERVIPENAYLMIHKPSTWCAGNADDLLKVVEVLDKLQEGIEATYMRAAQKGITEEYIHELVNAETWMTGTEASTIFNVDVIPACKAVAHAGKHVNRLHKIPTTIEIADSAKTEVEENKIDDDIKMKKAKCALALAALRRC